jgi:hypothetical protein
MRVVGGLLRRCEQVHSGQDHYRYSRGTIAFPQQDIKGNMRAHHPFIPRTCVQKDSINEVQALKAAVGKLTNLGGACPTLPLPCYLRG